MKVSYDGTNYHGFQKQNRTGLRTVQEALEEALGILTRENIVVHGSGRTDAGVHASCQVINFHSNTKIPAARFPLAVNSVLPPDIVVYQAEDVSADFHARFSARKKTYCYTIFNERQMSPFWRFYAYHVPVWLDVDKMREGADGFLGTHDFRAFCAKNTAVQNFTRTVFDCRIEKEGPLLRFFVQGNGFLYNMVRIITGTLMEIGKGRRESGEIPVLLAGRERKLVGQTLPPQGLCLVAVEYSEKP